MARPRAVPGDKILRIVIVSPSHIDTTGILGLRSSVSSQPSVEIGGVTLSVALHGFILCRNGNNRRRVVHQRDRLGARGEVPTGVLSSPRADDRSRATTTAQPASVIAVGDRDVIYGAAIVDGRGLTELVVLIGIN